MRLASLAPVTALLLSAAPVQAQNTSFTARVDRTTIGLNETLVCEITLAIPDGGPQDYAAPNFRGFEVLSESPSQSTQFRMGGGATFRQTTYTWRYELRPQKKGQLTVGAARVQVGGRGLQTTPVTVTVTEPVAVPAAPRAQPSPFGRQHFGFAFPDPFADSDDQPPSPPPNSSRAGGENFLRAIPSKTRVYVGEAVTVEWRLYLSEQQDRYQANAEPRADGFWVEDIPVPANRGGLALSQVEYEGRTYLVAPLLKKILFPLHAGALTVTPLSAEISRVDFFGTKRRSQKLDSETVAIEALPLPAKNRPAGFDDAAVGKFTLTARVDRNEVRVGEAITFTLTIQGHGNLRKLTPPRLPVLPGMKSYEPKVTVTSDPGQEARGEKRSEILLLPEQPGEATIPAIVLAYFDPETAAYATAASLPIDLRIIGDPAVAATGPATAQVVAPPGTENIIGADVRPPHLGIGLRRAPGATLYRTSLFPILLAVPPVAYAFIGMLGLLRARAGRDTASGRKKRLRRAIRTRLAAAEKHRAAGHAAAFAAEIERVLHEVLGAKLHRPMLGLSRAELSLALAHANFPPEITTAIFTELDECDRSRFAAGSIDAAAMTTALERAGELIARLEQVTVSPPPMQGSS